MSDEDLLVIEKAKELAKHRLHDSVFTGSKMRSHVFGRIRF